MATDGKTNRWNGIAYQAADERLMDSPLLMPGPSAEPFSARAGRRVNGGGLAVSVGTGPDSWTVTPGAGVIYDSTYAAQGAWRFEIPASISGTFPARPGAGQSRIDLIVARIYDSDIPVGAVKEVKIERVNGTAGATPIAPTVPDLSLVLATVTVPTSGAMTVTASTSLAVAAGGILPVATTAQRNALPNPWRGLVVDNAQTGKLERYNGTAWKTIIEVDDTGWVNCTYRSGYSGTLQVRKRDTFVVQRGYLTRTSGFNANFENAAIIPAGFFPSAEHWFAIGVPATTTLQTARGNITTAGDLQLSMTSASPTNGMACGTSWYTD